MKRIWPAWAGRPFPPPGEYPDEPDGAHKARQPTLSDLGEQLLDRIAIAQGPGSGGESEVVETEFLVCPGGLCIPTEGALRVEEILGAHYVIGRSSWERCESRAAAQQRLAQRIADLDPHELASEALIGEDPFAAADLR